ncbi:aminopeptidase [Halobacteriales archaeon Cl-PHB]
MDPRVRDHAEILVDYCVEIEAGDNVIVKAPPVAEDLVVALHEVIGERGGLPTWLARSSRVSRAYLRAIDEEAIETKSHDLAAMEEADAVIIVQGATNTKETSDVDSGMMSAAGAAFQPVLDARIEKRWVGTQYPTPANAQDAEMSTAAYEDFVYDAVNKDWEAQREFQAQMVEILEAASEVRIRSGEETDIRMSVDGMHAENDYGKVNMPAGEAFTCPVPDSVEGTVLFDKPLVRGGRELTDVRLTFEEGEVVDYSAADHEEMLASIVETDEGSRRLGELGIGMNRDIDRFTYNMLFDEKMGDTIHLALGKAFEECVGDDREFNESAQHVDMIVDMSEDSTIEVDGEVVQEDGTFVFEE